MSRKTFANPMERASAGTTLDDGTVMLSLDQVEVDGGTQMRAGIDPDVVLEYQQHIHGGGVFPPVVVFYDGELYWLADGFHRMAAYRNCNEYRTSNHQVEVSATVKAGTRRDAILAAAGANATHGLRRTNEDKARAVRVLLEDDEWVKWSDREVARRCAVTHPFVGKLRKEMEEESVTGNVTSDEGIHGKEEQPAKVRTYVNRHGERSQMNVSNIGSSASSTASAGKGEGSQISGDLRAEKGDEGTETPDGTGTAEGDGAADVWQTDSPDVLPDDLVDAGWVVRQMVDVDGNLSYLYRLGGNGRHTRATECDRDMDRLIVLARKIEDEGGDDIVVEATGTVVVWLTAEEAELLKAVLRVPPSRDLMELCDQVYEKIESAF